MSQANINRKDAACGVSSQPPKQKHMKTRILRNWRTSLLGLALLIITIILLFKQTITGGEFIALLPIILGLLYVQDSVFKVNPK